MTVHALIPVHNRRDCTDRVLRCLARQDFADVRTCVVDDGSSDGTADHVAEHFPQVQILRGDGSLWWAGAMALGLRAILARAVPGDFVLFLNNDTWFQDDYVKTLATTSEAYGRAIVGSMLVEQGPNGDQASLGPIIDFLRTRVETLKLAPDPHAPAADRLSEVVELAALSGRGTLYPVEVFHRVGILRPRWLPHYLADYEMAARARAAGFRTLVATRARIWTPTGTSGIDARRSSAFARLFSRRSRSNIVDAIVFFTLSGPWLLRITAPARVIAYRAWSSSRAMVRARRGGLVQEISSPVPSHLP